MGQESLSIRLAQLKLSPRAKREVIEAILEEIKMKQGMFGMNTSGAARSAGRNANEPRFEETRFDVTRLKVYTNRGKQIAGQTVCKLELLDDDGNVRKVLVGVASLSIDDARNGEESSFVGRKLSFGRAIARLSKKDRLRGWELFLADDNLNGRNRDSIRRVSASVDAH